MPHKVLILGSAHPLRGGGIATFNERLARAFMENGDTVMIASFSLQYPSFLFPGKTQYSDEAPPQDLHIKSWLNSINPFNWFFTAIKIRKWQPDLVVVRYWLPFMGPSLGTVCRLVKKGRKTKIVAVVDNAIPHEKRPGDRIFTRWFVKSVDAFITMSQQVMQDLEIFDKKRPRLYTYHPLYDNFGALLSKAEACKKLNLDPSQNYYLFFGFIRDYKGLDMLLEAIATDDIKKIDFKLIIAGEYYANASFYEKLIEKLKVADKLIKHTRFISNDDVKYYFSAADLIIQPYKNATQSGVTQIAYHFEKPILTTHVGGLAEIVLDGQTGIIVDAHKDAVAKGIKRFYLDNNKSKYAENIKKEKTKYTWDNFIKKIYKVLSKES